MRASHGNVRKRQHFGQRDTQWWKPGLTDADRYRKLMSAVKKIRQTQIWRKQADLQHLRLYGNAPILGFGVANYTKPAQLGGGKVGLNIVRACSDALTAKLCSDEMKAMLLTSGADWDLQRKAENLEKFLDGQRYQLDLDEKIPAYVLQACIFGRGFSSLIRRAKVRTRPSASTWCRPGASSLTTRKVLYGRPPTFYQRMWYDRTTLRSMFDGDRKAQDLISRAKLQTDEDLDAVGYQATADQILVTEAWHIPSFPGATEEHTDGCHMMAIENGMLYADPYWYPEPPLIPYTLWPQPLGFFGVGMAQQLQGLQIELNVLLQKVQRSFHLLGAGHWTVEKSSRVNKHKIDNDIGSIIEYMGTEPRLTAANPVPTQIFEHIDRIYTRAFEIAGISSVGGVLSQASWVELRQGHRHLFGCDDGAVQCLSASVAQGVRADQQVDHPPWH